MFELTHGLCALAQAFVCYRFYMSAKLARGFFALVFTFLLVLCFSMTWELKLIILNVKK